MSEGRLATCGPICVRLAPESRRDLDAALLAARQGPPAESLNAISRRTGIRKSDLIRHRDECLGAPRVVQDRSRPPARSESGPPRTGSDSLAGPSNLLTTRARATQQTEEDQEVRDRGPVHHSVNAEQSLAGIQSLAAQRAHHIAGLMVTPHWKRKRIHELAAEWGVSADSVRGYARAAAAILSADRGQLDQQREVSVAYVTQRRDRARGMVTRQTKIADELAETAADESKDMEVRIGAMKSETFARKSAVDAGKLEQKWQEHLDRIAGVLTNGAPMNVQVNNYNSEKFAGTMGAILGVLERHPEVKAEVMEAVAADHARRVTPAK